MRLYLTKAIGVGIHETLDTFLFRQKNVPIHSETRTRVAVKGRQFRPEAQKRDLLILVEGLKDTHTQVERLLILVEIANILRFDSLDAYPLSLIYHLLHRVVVKFSFTTSPGFPLLLC